MWLLMQGCRCLVMHEYGSINGKQPGRRGGPLGQDWSPLEAPWLLLYPGAHSHRQIPLAEPTCPAAHATMHAHAPVQKPEFK